MEYVMLHIRNVDEIKQAILMDQLFARGFETFEEKETEILCYIKAPDFDPEKTDQVLKENKVSAEIVRIPEQNWNEEWEKNFSPVDIIGKCYIRAPFHPEVEGYQYEIIIEPKMSFGTAHHETTSMMLELMLPMDLSRKTVLDMGCGTGILAILAHKMKAGKIVAIDNDEWAYTNTRENVIRNAAEEIEVLQGGIEAVPDLEFDVILANINRNILLDQIRSYAAHLKEGGSLFMSGFYEADLPVIEKKVLEHGLKPISFLTKNQWVAAKYHK